MSKKASQILLTVDEVARTKFKIAVDASLYGVGRLLEKERYNVYFAPPRIANVPPECPNVHDHLVKESVKIFITKNKDHFNAVYGRNYALIELALGGLDEPGIAKILEKVTMYDPDLKPVTTRGIGKKQTRYRKIIIDGIYMKDRYPTIVRFGQ